MEKKRSSLRIIFPILVGGLVCFSVLKKSPNNISFEKFECIRKGMTTKDVEDLFGGPPGRYVGVFFPKIEDRLFPCSFKIWGGNVSYRQIWQNEKARISVWFCEQGKVIGCSFTRIEPLGIVYRIQLLLGLKKYPV